MSLKIKESELKALLEEVASDLSKAFESEKDKLAKADLAKDDAPGEETPGEDESAPPAPEEGSESAAPPDAPPAADASAPPADASAPPMDASAPVDPAADQGAQLTPEALEAEYKQLPPEELDMHIQAALAAKAAVAGAPDASMGAPPAPPAGPPAASPFPSPAGPPMAMKSELKINSANTGGKISKSETEELRELVKSQAELMKSQAEDIAALHDAVKRVVEQPQRKAVLSFIPMQKAEPAVKAKPPLTKASIQARLVELSKRPDLKKSDRQLINDFYDGRIQVDGLAPLFEDYNK